MSRQTLIDMARHNIEHVKAGTVERAETVYRVPATNYYDPERWEREVKAVFRRMPLMLAMTCELPNNGDYKAMEVAGVPVLITRDMDGEIRAFVNSCGHRGAQVMPEGCGNTHRFTCPYHAWSFNHQGELTAVFSEKEFGEIDKSQYGLLPLPALEKVGLIWVTLDPNSTLDIDQFLCGYDEVLKYFRFEHWHHFSSRKLVGPNWKIAYDGYLDLYHLPILHRETFGPEMSHKSFYYEWGPHQRVTSPDPTLVDWEDVDEEKWSDVKLMNGVWTIFPHISIASFDGGGRSVMISQLFPGDKPGESITIQNYVMEAAPNEEQAKEATDMFNLLEYVVRDEDYFTGLSQQRALEAGFKDHVLFGRNEEGGQRFHGWVERLLDTPDADLPKLFK